MLLRSYYIKFPDGLYDDGEGPDPGHVAKDKAISFTETKDNKAHVKFAQTDYISKYSDLNEFLSQAAEWARARARLVGGKVVHCKVKGV